MTLDDLGNIGELIGAIGVIVTLIYLATQIRQKIIFIIDPVGTCLNHAYAAEQIRLKATIAVIDVQHVTGQVNLILIDAAFIVVRIEVKKTEGAFDVPVFVKHPAK